MPNILQNKLNSNWKNYSPGGKRRKVTNIPFMGQLNNDIRAMGTKKVGVLPNKFSNGFAFMQLVNFSKKDSIQEAEARHHPGRFKPYFTRNIKYSDLTPDDLKQLSPQEVALLRKREEEELADKRYQNFRQDIRQTRSSWNSALSTSKELRNWGLVTGMLQK